MDIEIERKDGAYDETVRRSRRLNPEDTREGSDEKNMFEMKHAEFVKVTKCKYRAIRLNMYDDYDEQVAKKTSAIKVL